MPLTSLIDFFLPRLCLACDSKLSPYENYVCSKCLSQLKYADEERIYHEFDRKFRSHSVINDFASLYVFEKDKEFQKIIHNLKYNGKFKAGIFLGSEAGMQFAGKISGWKIDLIVPIPLYRMKKIQRGYNQSFYIAKGICMKTGIKISEGAVYRKKNTQSQTTMNLKEREENIKDAFGIRKKVSVKGKNILLVDDVITTGSTVNECGKILKQSGAISIYALSAAIADLESEEKKELIAEYAT